MNVETNRRLLQVSGGKDSVSTDTETPFIFADVTDYLLDVGDAADVHIAVQRSSGGRGANHGNGRGTGRSGELAVVTDPLTTQRMSHISDD